MKVNHGTQNKTEKNNTIKKIFFTLIVLLIFILSLEAVLRTTHLFGARISWSEPDPVIGWRYTPNSRYWYQSVENDHPTTGKINNFGWRDKNWSINKPPDLYRVAVLGDSYVEAFQVESELTFLSLSEKALNDVSDNNVEVEFMNFGRSGFTQTEELIILKNEVLQFSPDMVILFFLPSNDIKTVRWETSREKRPYFKLGDKGELVLDTSFSKTPGFKIRSLINYMKQRSALVSLLTEKYVLYLSMRREAKQPDHIKSGKREAKQPDDVKTGFLSLATSEPDQELLINYNLNKLLIKEMADLSRELGIRFMLVTIDIGKSYMPEQIKEIKLIDASFNDNFFDDDLAKFSRSLNIEYLGLHRIFKKTYNNSGLSLHWGHWNYEGHEVVAKALTSKIRELKESLKVKDLKAILEANPD